MTLTTCPFSIRASATAANAGNPLERIGPRSMIRSPGWLRNLAVADSRDFSPVEAKPKPAGYGKAKAQFRMIEDVSFDESLPRIFAEYQALNRIQVAGTIRRRPLFT